MDAALPDDRIVLGAEPEDERHEAEDRCPDQRDVLPAAGEQHEGRHEFGDSRADIADAEDAERGALLAGRIEARDIGYADSKGAAGQSDTQRRDKHLAIGFGESQ
jgi:hypothetical protein